MSKRTKKSVTVTTIAETLNLSPSTVSFVLSGKAKERAIGDKTAQRVRQMAEKMNYVPNYWARSLRFKRSRAIGVLLDHMTNNWADSVLKTVTNVLHKKDFMPFIATTWGDVDLLQRAISEILQRQDEGVITSSAIITEDDYQKFKLLRIPVVFLGVVPSALYSKANNIHTVLWDEEKAVRDLVKHLYKTGRRKIMFAGMRGGLALEENRLKAFLRSLDELGLEKKPERIFWGKGEIPKFAEFFKPIYENKKDRPDSILCMTDGIAMQVWRDLDKIGIKVPDDIGLVGMGGWQKLLLNRVGLTTAVEPLDKMGEFAASLLLDLIDKQDSHNSNSENLVVSTEISFGKTC